MPTGIIIVSLLVTFDVSILRKRLRNRFYRSLQSDLRHCEEERDLLQRKTARLEDALKAAENGASKSLDDTQPAVGSEDSDSPFLRCTNYRNSK